MKHSPETRRVDIYAGIHKALRAMMMDTLHAVGSVDEEDAAELHAVCGRVLGLADACASHLGHENDFVHSLLEEYGNGPCWEVAQDHREHLVAIAELRALVTTLRAACRGAAQAAAAQALYRQLALFIADNFVHMHTEEVEHNQMLWARCSDDELRALEGRIVAAITPAEHLETLRWMVPAMAPAERAQVLAGVRAHASASAFAAVLGTLRPHLDEKGWAKLNRDLEAAFDNAPA